MAQDDSKGPQPSTRGRSPAPSTPGSPDTRGMKAPAAPEAPEAESEAEPVVAGAEPDSADPGDSAGDGGGSGGESGGGSGGEGGGGSGGEGGGGTSGKSESELLSLIDRAQKDLEALKADLARAEERRKAEDATRKMVEDYAREKPALDAIEEDLKDYRLAEFSFVSQFLDEATRKDIADAAAAQQQEKDDLARQIKTDAEAIADKRVELDAARAKAAAAKAGAVAWKRPAASIRDRLKAADAIRAEAKKASDAGNYALAYWLVMEDGRLDRTVAAAPRVIPTSELETKVRQSAADQTEAEGKVAALESEVKAAEAALEADRAGLTKLEAGFEAKVRASLAQFNPKPAEAA